MEQRVVDLLEKHRVCALTVLLPDGTPHAAAMHFSHKDNPLVLYFQTENTSRKYGAFAGGKKVAGSVVVGFSEEEWVTLQMDGELETVSDKAMLEEIYKTHYGKHPMAEKYKNDPGTVFMVFRPAWWRWSDYKTTPATILTGA